MPSTPILSGFELKDARKCVDDAAFRRDRLQAALGKLQERRQYQETGNLHSTPLKSLAARLTNFSNEYGFVLYAVLPFNE